MGVVFLITVLIFIIPGALLHSGDPQVQGRLAGLIALLVAVIVGWWHLGSMNRVGTVASKQAPPKP